MSFLSHITLLLLLLVSTYKMELVKNKSKNDKKESTGDCYGLYFFLLLKGTDWLEGKRGERERLKNAGRNDRMEI